jgi:outer membrane protein assembly factor BamE
MTLLRQTMAFCVTAVSLLLSACSTIDDPMARAIRKVTPYRVEVVQGNFVSKEQVQALRVGMSRNQVKDILGTPLIASVFHSDRWDYAFTIVRKGTKPQQRQLSVYFNDELYVRFDGDDLPSESEFAERIAVPEDRKVVPRLEATSKELEKFQKNAPAPVSATPKSNTPPADKAYPPLETP